MSWTRLAGAVLASLTLGCGYSAQLRLPEGQASVGVEVFDNDSPRPILERALYESLDRNVARMVDARIEAPSNADVVIRGRIIDYYRLAGVFGAEGDLSESGVTLHVRAWLVERDTEQRVGLERDFVRQVRYAIGVGQAESGALELALDNLSQELVLDLFSPTNYELSVEEEPELPLVDPPELRPRDENE